MSIDPNYIYPGFIDEVKGGLNRGGSGGSGLPDGSNPNQYIVTDGEGKAGWADRTHWVDILADVVFEEQEVALEFQYAKTCSTNTKITGGSIEVGKDYRVTLNGVPYICTAIVDGYGRPKIGAKDSEEMINHRSDYPFSISNGSSDFLGSMESVRIGIEKITTIIHPLDKKFLPSESTMPALAEDGSDAGKTVKVNRDGSGYELGEGGSGLPAGAKPNQYIVTDGEGNAKWEDNPHSVGVVVEKTITTKAGTDYIWSGSMYGVTAYFFPIFMGEREEYETKRVFSLIEGETYIFTDMDGVEHTAIAQRQGDVVVAAGSDRSFGFSDYGASTAAIMFLGSAETGLNANAYSFSGKFLQKEVDTDPGVTVDLTFDEGGLWRAEINGKRDQDQVDTIATLIYNMGYYNTKINAFWETKDANTRQDVMLLKLYFSGGSNYVLEEMWADIWGYRSTFATLNVERVYIYGEGGEGGGVE